MDIKEFNITKNIKLILRLSVYDIFILLFSIATIILIECNLILQSLVFIIFSFILEIMLLRKLKAIGNKDYIIHIDR